MATDTRNIVILGAGFAGVGLSHYLLQTVLPTLPESTPYRVVLINQSPDFLNPMPAPRGIVASDLMPRSKFIEPLSGLFSRYPSAQFGLEVGRVTGVDLAGRTVEVEVGGAGVEGKGEGAKKQVRYHALVIATGMRTSSEAWSVHSSIGATNEVLTATEAALAKAKTVLIAGGGPVGVETAGEIGNRLNGQAGWFASEPAEKKAKVTVLSGGQRLLGTLRPSLAALAERKLKAVGVDVVHGVRVVKTEMFPSKAGQNQQTRVTLDNGDTLTVDVYISAVGTVPNTTPWAPDSILTKAGKIANNPTTLRVDAPEAGARVYALGDVGSHTTGGVVNAWNAVPVVGTNLKRDLLADGDARAANRGADREWTAIAPESQLVPVGMSGGVGAWTGWRLPSLMVWFLKCRDYMTAHVRPQLDGRHWTKP